MPFENPAPENGGRDGGRDGAGENEAGTPRARNGARAAHPPGGDILPLRLEGVCYAPEGRTLVGELRAEEGRLEEERLPQIKSDATPIHPYRLVYEIDQFLDENTQYIGDGGDIVTFSGQVVKPRGPGLWMDPGPLGTLGVGIPFVLASKLVFPERKVVALFGDGAFGLTGFDFETLVRLKLPFVGVVGNNSAMNQIRFGQINKYGKERGDIGNMMGDVHFDDFAKMLGGHGEEVRDPKDIRPALERAQESGLPSLINVWIDPDAYSPGTQNQTMYK